MELLNTIVKEMRTGENHLTIVMGMLVAWSLGKTHFYRYLRKYAVPITAVVLLYRSLESKGHHKTVLSELVSLVKSSNSSVLQSLCEDAFGLIIAGAIVRFASNALSMNMHAFKKLVMGTAYDFAKMLPSVQAKLNKEKVKMEHDLDKDLKSRSRAIGQPNLSLPKTGLSGESILTIMKTCCKAEDVVWETGRISGAVYHGVREHQDLLNKAFGMYSICNPLHPEIWPSTMKFESEIVAMTASLVAGSCSTVCGCTSSGGTESIILAIKAHRDYARQEFGITEPEMLVCVSAHAAVDKGCDLMGIKLIKVPMDPNTFKVDLHALRRAIGPNTIMMYASAPSYPHGAIDPVSAMSKMAVEFNIGLHVDCCLGGFVLPFARKLGFPVPEFDFSLPGVTSMSLDTHKYGYALKGASVLLYRNRELRQAQYFCYADWVGGMYTTPTIAGSRSGGLIAQCWASLMALGEEGYMTHVKDIMQTAQVIAAGVAGIEGLEVIGGTQTMIVCMRGTGSINIYCVSDRMSKRGWALNTHQSPPCVHICCTVRHVGIEDQFIQDIRECVAEVRANPQITGNAAIYGLASQLPSGPVNELLKLYNDVVLKA